ncbi:hypothetical protein V1264_002881 [Littorina saxatilis]|uniref:Nuclear envelope membrane protein n=2 Tax=Littorina saxatilis TaxID=31220 RepID=A0AAN9G8A2_9CAEN
MLVTTGHVTLLLGTSFLLGSCIPQLVMFISSQGLLGSDTQSKQSLRNKYLKDWTDEERRFVLTRLFKDFMLVVLFVLQHSLMAGERWKRFLLRCDIYISERLIYVMASCFTLTLLMRNWASTPDVILWGMDTENHGLHWLFFCALHTAAWLLLFLQVAVMDPWELIGVEQVYNHYKGKASPLSYVPKQLRIFYQHLRHAGPTSLWVMLWIHPVMTMDRFLLALIFSVFLAMAHQVSLADYKFAQCYFVSEESTTFCAVRPRPYRDY